jgi:hypothetical protein
VRVTQRGWDALKRELLQPCSCEGIVSQFIFIV